MRASYLSATTRAPARAEARRWIDSEAGGGPDYGGADAALPELPKRAVNDRWAQHTSDCTRCAAAAAGLRRGAAAAWATAAALFAAECALLGTFGAPALLARAGPGLAAAGAAAGSVGAVVWALRAQALLREFDYVDFSRSDSR
jgi:hypothetical protein